MALGQFAGDGQAQARAAGPAGAGKGLEQPRLEPLGHAGPGVGEVDHAEPLVLAQVDADHAVAVRVRLGQDRLARIAQEVDQDAVQLLGIGAEARVRPDRGHETHAFASQAGVLGRGLQRRQHVQGLELRRGLLALAVGQHVLGQVNGAVQRPLQPRHRLGDLGIARLGQAFGGDLGAGQHVAQVVVDLGHRLAQRRQPGARPQRLAQVGLHAVQLGLGAADLVAAPGRLDVGGRIVRVGPEPLHRLGDPLHRPHQERVQREIDEAASDDRDEQVDRRKPQQIAFELDLQRRVGHHDLDEVAVAKLRARHHPHHPAPAAEQGVQRREQARGAAAQIDQVGRARHPRRGQQQPAHAAALHRHRDDAGAIQELGRELVADLLVGRGVDRQ